MPIKQAHHLAKPMMGMAPHGSLTGANVLINAAKMPRSAPHYINAYGVTANKGKK
jgi:hypothetical protein